VDQTHEHVADPGAIKRLVAGAVLAMHDRHLEGLLAAVVVQRRAGSAKERAASASWPNVKKVMSPPRFSGRESRKTPTIQTGHLSLYLFQSLRRFAGAHHMCASEFDGRWENVAPIAASDGD
jgi:hypothetical protein